MDRLSKQSTGSISSPGSTPRTKINLFTDPEEGRLNEEIQVVQVELKKQYESHIEFVQAVSNIKEAEVRQLKAMLDKQLGHNLQKEKELARLREYWEDTRKRQEDVVPLSERMRPTTSATSPRSSLKSPRTYEPDFIPVLLERVATLEHDVTEVEDNCLMCETESERILQMLSIEKQATLILKERLQQAKELHKRFMKKYDSVLQTHFVARNYKTLAENEVIKQKISNEDLRRRFREGMSKQNSLRKTTEQEVQDSIEKISIRSLQLKSKQEANVQMIQEVEQSLQDFTSTRRQLQASEAMLTSFKDSFATIMKVIEERTGKDLAGVGYHSPEAVKEVLLAFKGYAYQEASLGRYFQDLTNDHDEKRHQCDALRCELTRLEQSKNLIKDRDTRLSVNLLRLSVEDQKELEAEIQRTNKTERCVLEIYLQSIEVTEVCSQGLKVIAENVPKLSAELKPLKEALEQITTEFGKGFAAKREIHASIRQSTSLGPGAARRRSEMVPTFPTEVEEDRERATDFFFNSVKPYLSLSVKEVEGAYLTAFPGREEEAEEFAHVVTQTPLICFCLSSQAVEDYLKQFPRDRALQASKENLGQLLSQAHTILEQNLKELTKKFVPLLRSLQRCLKKERAELFALCEDRLPKRVKEVEEATEPLNSPKRQTRYTPQQRDQFTKKISSLLSNQRGAEDEFVIENKYITEDCVLRPGAKLRPKTEVSDERTEQDFVSAARLEFRRNKTAHGARREIVVESCPTSVQPERKTRAQEYLDSLKGIEGRLSLLKMKEKGVQNDYGQQKYKFQPTSRSILAPLKSTKMATSQSLNDIQSARPTTQPFGHRLGRSQSRLLVAL